MNQNNEEIRKILESIPEDFQILESATDWDVHENYIQLSEKISLQEISQSGLIAKGQKLFQETVLNDFKKELLVRLGNSGKVEAYRIIEKFYNHCTEELKTWSAIALCECRMLLENQLTDDNIGFISTGLGGKANKLRYLYVIISQTGENFSLSQQKLINIEFDLVCKALNSEIEKVDYRKDYACLTVLIPMDIDPDTFIMKGIHKCNEIGNFIFSHYFVTNTEIPTSEEIENIIEGVRKDVE